MSKSLGLFVVAGCIFSLSAASPSIGVIRSSGEFRVDGAAVRGNATLFEGSLVETAGARSMIRIDGAQITLLPQSRVTVFRDHVQAGALRISSSAKGSVVEVQTAQSGRVDIAAATGVAEVRDSAGTLVAVVRPGLALDLNPPQGGATSAFQATGVLESRNGKFYLTDSTTHVTVELQGTDLAKYVGKTVEVTGSTIPGAPVATGVSQVVQVVTINPVTRTHHGLSNGAKGAIIGGVVVGGTVGGLAAAGTFSSSPSLSNK
jgi:hypothetical protein